MPAIETHFSKVHEQKIEQFTVQEVSVAIRKTHNFKAPGLDGIQNIILKKLTNLHPSLCYCFNALIKETSVPSWLLQGRTTLIQKKSTSEFQASNYRPITCLSNVWKLLSSCLSDRLYSHFKINNILPCEQKGCIKNCFGTIDQLLIDKAITNHARQNQRNLYVSWIDFRKAFDSVSHEWIFKCLELFKVNKLYQQFLYLSFSKFLTHVYSNSKIIGKIPIKRGIFQGDSLSPLLFITSLAPLSVILNN